MSNPIPSYASRFAAPASLVLALGAAGCHSDPPGPIDAAPAMDASYDTMQSTDAADAANTASDAPLATDAPAGDGSNDGGVPRPGPIVNVRDYGAVGDGVADDQPAINAAAAVIANAGHGTLYFPLGTYRAARQPTRQSGIAFRDIQNVTIDFEPGAILQMDNLDPTGLGDRGHGIDIRGASRHIWLLNVDVEWKTAPSNRSLGDGIHFDGYPTDAMCGSDVHLIHPVVRRTPQAGIIFMGVSDIEVRDAEVDDTQADAMHFNACRRITVDTYHANRNGDDALAIVTYYDPNSIWVYADHTQGPYAQPGLGEFSDSNSTFQHIFVNGGNANGCRIDSALNVQVTDLNVVNKAGSGLFIDGTEADHTHYWTVIASQGVVVDGLDVRGSNQGFTVIHAGAAGDPFASLMVFWNFDVQIRNVTVNDNLATNAGGRLQYVAGANVSHIAGNDRLATNVNNCRSSGIDPN